MTKKTLIIIGVVVALVVLLIIILSSTSDNTSTDEGISESSSTPTGHAAVSNLPAAGYPITAGSYGNEVQYLQLKLNEIFGTVLNPDGDWGTNTNTAALNYLNKDRFGSQAELDTYLAYYGHGDNTSGVGLGNVINIVTNWLG